MMKGIQSLSVFGAEVKFGHDMTATFLTAGISLGLITVKLAKLVAEGNLRPLVSEDKPVNSKHITQTAAEETELHEFCCERCGYTMFPARGRDKKFFPDNFKCPHCKAPKDCFFDMTDLSDPRTREALENDEYFDYDIENIEVPVKEDDNDGKPAGGKDPPPSPQPPPPRAPASPPQAVDPATSLSPPTPAPLADDDDFDPLNNPLL